MLPTATATPHIISKSVPDTNIPLNATYMANIKISSCAHIKQLF